jgi:hypothetical protein
VFLSRSWLPTGREQGKEEKPESLVERLGWTNRAAQKALDIARRRKY